MKFFRAVLPRFVWGTSLFSFFAAVAHAQQTPMPQTPRQTPVSPTPPSPTNAAVPAAVPAPTSPVVNTTPSASLPQPITVPAPALRPSFNPFPQLPNTPLDEAVNGIGIAQQLTRTRNVQGRVMWVDATANLDRVNTVAKINDLVGKIKAAGFNTIVFDVKPIIGMTLYPSQYAPKLTEWTKDGQTQTLPADFDPLRVMVNTTRQQNISLFINFNTFAEGHTLFRRGPGYDNPRWQTTLYEPDLRVRRDEIGTAGFAIMDRPNLPPRDDTFIAVYNDIAKLKTDYPATGRAALLVVVDTTNTVLAQTTSGAADALNLAVPAGGAILVAQSPQATNFARLNCAPGLRLRLDNTPSFVPISQRPDDQYPLMTNPNSPEVRQRLLSMLAEVVLRYEVDGVIFDDRLRYAGLNADFSPATQREFETWVGKPLRWPDDVFRYDVSFPSLDTRQIPGPYYDAWLTFRALTIRNWLADAVRTIKTNRPTAQVATYVGSNYPDYPQKGANWASDDLQAGYRFLNESYQKTGWAGMVDWLTTGCYYRTPTIMDAALWGTTVGETVEAAGQFSNRAVGDQTFVYAGITLELFQKRPELLRKVLQAAAASTQGIMVFDYSHNFDLFAPTFAETFAARPALAPHQTPGLLTELRTARAAQKAAGTPTPPVILNRGASGTGF